MPSGIDIDIFRMMFFTPSFTALLTFLISLTAVSRAIVSQPHNVTACSATFGASYSTSLMASLFLLLYNDNKNTTLLFYAT